MKIFSNNNWTNKSPYERFHDFIAPEADHAKRYAVILEQIEKLWLNAIVVQVAGNHHIFVFPRKYKLGRHSSGSFPFRGKSPIMLVAHYDRVKGSPGANDNSIAVFHLLKAAVILEEREMDHWVIVFTDKEELSTGEGIVDQGSFTLAEKLISWGLEKTRIYNFDACGTGDTFIISATTDLILRRSERPGVRRAKERIRKLREHALGTAGFLRLNKVLQLPTPFSDDAGFLRAGLPAQTITMLPGAETKPYVLLLRKQPEYADLFLSEGFKNKAHRHLIPETWRILNKATDKAIRLTPQYFHMVVNFAAELCR